MAAVQPIVVHGVATGQDLGARGPRLVQGGEHTEPRLSGDQRAQVGPGLRGVTDAQGRDTGEDPLDQWLGDVRNDDDPAGRRALLAGGRHRTGHDPIGGEVEVGVLEDQRGVVATGLELVAGPACAGGRRDGVAGRGRAGEAHRCDVR